MYRPPFLQAQQLSVPFFSCRLAGYAGPVSGHPVPDHDGLCDICRHSLGPSYWVHDRHLLVHDHCRPWHEVEFPFDEKLKAMRRAWRETGQGPKRDKLRADGVWLRQRKRVWPEGALETVRGVKARGL